MRKLLLLLGLLLGAVGAHAACSYTTVTDTLYDGAGNLANGTFVVTPVQQFTCGGVEIYPISTIINVVNGAFSLQLAPNDTAVPANTYYNVRYALYNSTNLNETWTVPTGGPVNLATIRTLNPPAPGFSIAASNITGTLQVNQGGTGTATAFTSGAVVFAGASGVYSQDTNFNWNATNHCLYVGTSSCGATNPLVTTQNSSGGPYFQTVGSGHALEMYLDNVAGGSQVAMNFANAGVVKYQVGNQGSNGFFMFDVANARDFLDESSAGSMFLQPSGGNVFVGGNTGSNYRLDVQSSGSSGTLRVFDQTPSTGSTGIVVQAGAGQSTNAILSFLNNSSVIMSEVDSSGGFDGFQGGVQKTGLGQNFLAMSSDSFVLWKNSTNVGSGSSDTCFGRNKAATVSVSDCGVNYGGLILSLVQANPQAFSSLPACASGTEGTVAEVNNSTTAIWGATISGGGTNKVLAHCNGANWTVFGS